MIDSAWSKKIIALFSIFIMLSACNSQKSITYFKDLKSSYEIIKPIENSIVIRIQPNDQLSISINSTNTETNTLFNSNTQSTTGYLVDADGFVTLPALGRIKVSGLTTQEAIQKITRLVSENYVNDPVVNIQITNFKVTVIGAVGSPQAVNSTSTKMNVVEALGFAGNIAPTGDPENVLIIREVNGTRSTIRINLLKKEAFNSPYFYLQQNDIIYVQPNQAADRAKLSETRSIISIVISTISIVTLVIARLF